MSLRGVQKVLKVFNKVFGFDYKIPSKSTIQNWKKKQSYYRLEKENTSIEGKWCIIIDESISIGEEKILLVLGVPLSVYKFEQSLKFEDIKTLQIAISKSWKAEEVSTVLNNIKSMGYDIEYVVSDGCPTLKCAVKMSKLLWVSDCSHAFGNVLKGHYQELEAYQSFDKLCGKLKKSTNLGENAVISPPKYRVKGKFLNLWERVKWANSMLKIMKKEQSERNGILTPKMQEKLAFVKDYEKLIEELHLQCETINKLHKILKNKGLSKETVEDCRDVLRKDYDKTMKEKLGVDLEFKSDFFYSKIEQYLTDQLTLFQNLNVSKIICTSDVIESMFGKYKERAKRSGSVVTDDCINIANFSGNFSKEETKKAMEEVKMVDIIEWRGKNCKDS